MKPKSFGYLAISITANTCRGIWRTARVLLGVAGMGERTNTGAIFFFQDLQPQRL